MNNHCHKNQAQKLWRAPELTPLSASLTRGGSIPSTAEDLNADTRGLIS